MSGGAHLPADPAVVRAFAERLHAHVATAFAGIHQPGMMQLVAIHPASEATISFPFDIGQVGYMVEEAIRQAETGHNVYVEARTIRKGARGKRGGLADTVGVFGLVNDADNDKGKGGHLNVEPSLVIETSPGNAHHWFLLDRPLPAEEARTLGAAIRAGAGADAASGVVTQPYRIPGTPNYPGKTKLARGRVAVPTGIVSLDGKVWSAAELQAAFPKREKPRASTGPRPAGASGKTSRRVEDLVAETGADRSSRFHAAVACAFADGLTPDDLATLMLLHPEGCGGKYLEPHDRLAREIERSWEKVEGAAAARWQAAETPAYEDVGSPIGEARRAVADGVARFLAAAETYRVAGDDEALPPVHALAVSTGVGKTRATARTVAAHVVARRGTAAAAKPILYAVPTHRLGAEIEAQFAEHGVTARVFRGREAPDPDRPGETMCDDVEAVKIALSLGATVQTACCKAKLDDGREARCLFFDVCSYQRQKDDRPEVWIVAHQMLFQAQPALGDIEIVIVDEGFWQTGLRIPKRGLTLDEIGAWVDATAAKSTFLANDVEVHRAQLARSLKRQERAGGVRRADLVAEGLTTEICTSAISAEWRLREASKVALWPGMPKAERRIAAKAAEKARHVQGFITVWQAARGLLYDETVEVSGRLYIDTRDEGDGQVLVVKARRLRTIAKQWQAPTLLLDATLPSLDILRAFYPQIEAAPAIEATMPHVRVRQVIDSPVAARKLVVGEDGSAGRNLRAVRREILRRFIALGRAPVLVIAQKAVSEWLRGSGLPDGIAVEHFNNVAGLDQYRAVRGLIVVGRTLPSPVAVEALAGAVTGREANLIPNGEWYPKPVRGLRTRDGKPVGFECETHPDPVADACRWLICEGELMQAIGRARGVNRTAANPLDIDIIANVVLPLTVDVAEPWSPAGEETEMQIDGVVLDSAADMAAVWPEVWATPQAARNWNHRRGERSGHSVAEPYKDISYIGFCNAVAFRYQMPGARQKWRTGAFDPAVVPDPRAWLESRLGSLAGFHVEGTAEPSAPPSAAVYDPTLAARYRRVASREPEAVRPAPVRAEVIRFDPADPTSFPSLIAGRLGLMRAAETAGRTFGMEVAE